MDWKEALGVIFAGIFLIVPAIKWLISDWSKKAKDLEDQKAANTAKSLGRLEDDIKDFRSAISQIEKELKSLSINISGHKIEIEHLKEDLKSTAKLIDVHSKGFDETVDNKIRTRVNHLVKQLSLIKNRQG